MRISFDWQNKNLQETKQKNMQEMGNVVQYGNNTARTAFYHPHTMLHISSDITNSFSYGEQGSFNPQAIQAVGAEDYIAVQRDMMTVMSNSMSVEDFQKMQEEGYNIYDCEPEEAVTILDKIKAVLAQSGTQIAGYNDNLSLDKMKEITGSTGYAQQIAKELQNADAPVTKENIKQVEEALQQALSLTPLGDGNIAYLLSQGMEPILSHLYKAGHSSVNMAHQAKNIGYVSNGYTSQGMDNGIARKTSVSVEDYQQMEKQIKQRIQSQGLEVNEKTLENGKWLVEKGIPLTGENLQLLQDIKEISYPLNPDTIIKQAANAIGEGKSAFDILVNKEEESIYKQAVDLVQRFQKLSMKAADYVGNHGLSQTLQNMEDYTVGTQAGLVNLQARKCLEEVRLKMTVEANLKLLQSGFSIDTAPMEELIQKLEEAEKQWEKSLFGESKGVGKGELFRQTLQQVAELPKLPLAVVGKIPTMENPTLDNISQEGKLLQNQYKMAQESYEALWTAPRADMGDHIQKAFRNVDAILQDMGLEITEANQRAIRIMGYNQITITEDNLQKIKEADRQVKKVMDNMKPGLTLQMIREGKNPLEMSLPQLEEYINQHQESFIQETEKYSKFLYKLEQNQDITEGERKAYIGVYRLFRQIEKTDGAAIGSLVAQGADLNFSNILSAIRSRKKSTDIRIDDSVGGLTKLQTNGLSISQQIEQGLAEIQKNLGGNLSEDMLGKKALEIDEMMADKETEQEYAQVKIQEIRTLLEENKNQGDYLKEYHQPITLDSMQSVGVLTGKRGSTFKQLRDLETKLQSEEEIQSSILEGAEKFLTVMDREEERPYAYEKMLQQAEEVLEQTLNNLNGEESYLDVKSMQQLYKQLHVTKGLAQEENYEIPVQMGEEITSINLRIIHNQEKIPQVKITFDTDKFGKVEARFQVTPNGLEGSVLTDYMDGKDILKNGEAVLSKAIQETLQESKTELKQLFFGVNEKLDINKLDSKSTDRIQGTNLLYKVAKEFIKYIKTL